MIIRKPSFSYLFLVSVNDTKTTGTQFNFVSENDFYELEVEILDHLLITKYSKAVMNVSHKYKWNNPSFWSCEVMGYSIRLYL